MLDSARSPYVLCEPLRTGFKNLAGEDGQRGSKAGVVTSDFRLSASKIILCRVISVDDDLFSAYQRRRQLSFGLEARRITYLGVLTLDFQAPDDLPLGKLQKPKASKGCGQRNFIAYL